MDIEVINVFLFIADDTHDNDSIETTNTPKKRKNCDDEEWEPTWPNIDMPDIEMDEQPCTQEEIPEETDPDYDGDDVNRAQPVTCNARFVSLFN